MTISIFAAIQNRTGLANVKDFGAVGDGVADDTNAFNDACNSGRSFIVPPADVLYKVTAPIILHNMDGQHIIGFGDRSRIEGNFNGYIFDRPSEGIIDVARIFDGLHIQNHHASGGGIHIDGTICSSITRCKIHAFRAISLFSDLAFDGAGGNFTTNIQNVRLTWNANTAGSIGIMSGNHTQITACDIVGFDHGVRAHGVTINITGCRLEVNNTAILLGQYLNGTDAPVSRSTVCGNSGEANVTFLDLQHVSACLFAGLGAQGSVNAPGGTSDYGMRLRDDGVSNCVFSGISMGGEYDFAAIDFGRTSSGSNNIAQAVSGLNAGAGVNWLVDADVAGTLFQQTNKP